MKKLAFMITGVAAAAILFTACGGSSGGGGGGGGIGPAGTGSFAGTRISFNPTIDFLANGQLTYTNTDQNSPFEYAPTPIAGTYSYMASPNYKSGTFFISLEGDEDDAESEPIIASNFVVENGVITSFKITFPEDGSFIATVESGVLLPAVSDDDEEPGDDNFTYEANGNLANGTQFEREYITGNTTGDITDSPLDGYTAGEDEDFRVSGGSFVFWGKGEDEISIPFKDAADGTIRYEGPLNGGVVTVIFDTDATEDQDLFITWYDLDGNVDGKVFGR